MTTATDAFGRTITVATNPDGTVTVTTPDGLSVHAATQDQALGTLAGMAPASYVPPAPPPPTTIASLAFIQRFTTAEQSTLMAANPMWGLQIAAAGTIDVTSPLLLTQMQAAVAAGALTQARMNQVLNLSVASP